MCGSIFLPSVFVSFLGDDKCEAFMSTIKNRIESANKKDKPARLEGKKNFIQHPYHRKVHEFCKSRVSHPPPTAQHAGQLHDSGIPYVHFIAMGFFSRLQPNSHSYENYPRLLLNDGKGVSRYFIVI